MSDEQYFTTQPQVASVAHSKDQNFAVLRMAGRDITVGTDRGVFSRKGIDQGTMVLLESAARPPSTGTFLDLGCGAGPIAMTMARRSPGCAVWAVDVNERARQLTRDNASSLGLTNITVATPDDIPSDVMFNVIWSNPPIKVGKQELHDLLNRGLARLSPDGYAVLVVNKNLGSDSLAKWLTELGWTVKRISSRQGFRVLTVKR